MPISYYSEDNNKETNPDEYFMRQALIEAQRAGERDEVPIGAVIVCQGRIIARGHNLTETLTDVTAHAEMQAITAAAQFLGGKYLIDCSLYVTVEPCVMCAGALGWSQISRVVYGASDEKRGFVRFTPNALHPKTEIVSGILEADCSKLVKEFFKRKRN
jgi:tRNA(adenine34) deaminase